MLKKITLATILSTLALTANANNDNSEYKTVGGITFDKNCSADYGSYDKTIRDVNLCSPELVEEYKQVLKNVKAPNFNKKYTLIEKSFLDPQEGRTTYYIAIDPKKMRGYIVPFKVWREFDYDPASSTKLKFAPMKMDFSVNSDSLCTYEDRQTWTNLGDHLQMSSDIYDYICVDFYDENTKGINSSDTYGFQYPYLGLDNGM